MVGCTRLDVVEFDDLKTLHAKDTSESCEHIEVGFNDGEWSTVGIVFGVVTESVGSERWINKLGDLAVVASLARLA